MQDWSCAETWEQKIDQEAPGIEEGKVKIRKQNSKLSVLYFMSKGPAKSIHKLINLLNLYDAYTDCTILQVPNAQ